MDKNNKQKIQKLAAELLEIRTQNISYETVELLAVFIIYADISKREVCIDEQYDSNKEFINSTIEDLSKNNEPVKELILPLKRYLASSLERVNDIINHFTLSQRVNIPHDGINYCLSLFEEYKGQHTDNLVTPRAILELSNDIFSFPDGSRVLDLNARKGEWSDLLTEGLYSEHLSLTDYCFEPSHFVINTLKAKLNGTGNRQAKLYVNYDLNDLERDGYNVVFSNPSFGNMPLESSWNPRHKIHTHFLYLALKACKPGGKIIFIVPESFLNSGGKYDYRLREELIKDGNLKTVIRLPSSAFEPYAKVHTAILVIEKGTEKSDVMFVDLNKKLNEFGSQEAQDILNLSQGKSLDSVFPYSLVNLNGIRESGFDLRASRYIEKGTDKVYSSPFELRRDIETKEKELEDVRLKIESLIGLMEQER
jgi:type I restriction-modification system DNA methylase subunit